MQQVIVRIKVPADTFVSSFGGVYDHNNTGRRYSPLSEFLLAAAAFRIPELGLVPNGAESVPDVSTEPESNES